MEFFKKALFIFFILFILFLFVWALYLPKQDITQSIAQTLQEQKDKLDLMYKGVTLQEASNGIKYWEIKAKTSSVNNSTGIATLEDTNGTFFSRGKPTLKFTAPTAIWNMLKKNIHLVNPIGYDAKSEKKNFFSFLPRIDEGKSYFEFPAKYSGRGEGFFFKAKNLSWDLKDQNVVCNDGIWIKKGQISGLAQSLRADVELEKIIVSGHPRINIDDTSPTVIEATEFEIDNPKNTLTALNGVALNANGVSIETKTATYEQSNNLIKLGEPVVASYKQFKAVASFAEYNIKTQKVTLTGNPTLQRGTSLLSGDAIIVNIKTKSFSVKGKSKIIIPEKELTNESI